MHYPKRYLSYLILLSLLLAGCRVASPRNQPLAAVSQDARGRSARLLSAFYGLDNALPPTANGLCRGAAGQDGMPVIFSHTLDQNTLQKEDFLVVTQSGMELAPFCVTLAPAVGAGELRTILVVGDLGSATTDPPITVRIVGDLLSDDATGGRLNFRGASVPVTPLELGPTLVWAESVPKTDWVDRGRNAGTDCPGTTVQVVRATWAGGITLPGGGDAGDKERVLYRVTIQRPDGIRAEVTPFALADLGDNDNNHSLCLDVAGVPLLVSFPAGHMVDPNGDLNPDTSIDVTQ